MFRPWALPGLLPTHWVWKHRGHSGTRLVPFSQRLLFPAHVYEIHIILRLYQERAFPLWLIFRVIITLLLQVSVLGSDSPGFSWLARGTARGITVVKSADHTVPS